MANLVYNETSVDHGAIPIASLVALAQRGLNHVMQNEVSSKVVGHIRKLVNPEKASDVTTEQVKAYRAEHDGEISALENSYRAEKWNEINNGTLGETTVRGPKVDPLTGEMRKIATALVRKQLAANNLKLSKEQKIVIRGTEFTLAELVSRRIERDREVIEREAKAALAEAARRMAKLEKASEEVSDEF